MRRRKEDFVSRGRAHHGALDDAPLYRFTNRFTNVDEEELYQEYLVERNAPRARTAAFVCSAVFLVMRAATWAVYFNSALEGHVTDR